MIKTKDELLSALSAVLGENTTDEALQLMEDLADTFENLQQSNERDVEKELKDLDEMWRKKYRDRFLNANTEPEKEQDEAEEEIEIKSYDELFEEEE